jgi:hypothetical protein
VHPAAEAAVHTSCGDGHCPTAPDRESERHPASCPSFWRSSRT